MPDLRLIRHAQTEWSATLRHTGRTDVPLSPAGRLDAQRLRPRVEALSLSVTLCSPLSRARETASLVGLHDTIPCDDLVELDYGEYEGLTTAEIQRTRPGWTVWTSDCPGGETLEDAGDRADAAIAAALAHAGDGAAVGIVAHGHILRILAARWLGQPASFGGVLALDTSTLCHLGFEHGARAIRRWNVAATG